MTPAVVRTAKVLDVCYMPEKLSNGDSIMDYIQNQWDWLGQDSYINYEVGLGDEMDDDEDGTNPTKELDQILINNYGLAMEETVILLVSW